MGDDEDDEVVVVVVIGNRVRPGSSTRWSAIDICVCVCMFSSVLFPTGKGRAEMGIIPCVERDRERGISVLCSSVFEVKGCQTIGL